nr:hypothetical protein [Sphingomonas liriopis]
MSPSGGDADTAALADLAAGRIVDSETVARWLGGWHLARAERRGTVPPDLIAALVEQRAGGDRSMPPPPAPRSDGLTPDASTRDVPLIWTGTAIADCHRVRGLLAHFGTGAEQRLAAGLIAAMVELIVDGPARPRGRADIPLLPPLVLRVAIDPRRIAVLGLRWTGRIT